MQAHNEEHTPVFPQFCRYGKGKPCLLAVEIGQLYRGVIADFFVNRQVEVHTHLGCGVQVDRRRDDLLLVCC